MNNTAEVIEVTESQVAEFNEFEASLAEYKSRYEGVIYDLSVPEQEKQAKSDRLAIGKVISNLDKTHKEVKAPLKERVDLLDGERKRIKDQLLELQGSIKGQIAEHEDRIKAEKDALMRRAGVFRDLREFEFSPTVEQVQERIDKINALEIDDSYGEMKAYAALNKEESLQVLVPMLAGLKVIAEQEAAAERQRIAAEENARKEREEHIAREAKEAAEREAAVKVEAERKAKVEAEKSAKEAAERAEQEKAEALERERIAKERAEQQAKEAAEHAEREKQEAVARAEAEAKRKAEEAERARLAEIERVKAEQAKREANIEHRAAINNAAALALVENASVEPDQAKSVIIAIAKGQIPSVTIAY